MLGFSCRSGLFPLFRFSHFVFFLHLVKQELNFLDKDTQFYRFQDSDCGFSHNRNETVSEEDLQEALSLLSQLGPDALLTMILRKRFVFVP